MLIIMFLVGMPTSSVQLTRTKTSTLFIESTALTSMKSTGMVAQDVVAIIATEL